MRSPKVCNHEILGAPSTYKKALVYEKSFSQRQKLVPCGTLLTLNISWDVLFVKYLLLY